MHFYRVYSYNVVKITDRSTYKIYLGQHFYTPIKDNKTTENVFNSKCFCLFYTSINDKYHKDVNNENVYILSGVL
jgi:hypothetical protein